MSLAAWAVAIAMVAVAACGGGGDDDDDDDDAAAVQPLVDQVSEAVTELETEQGGPQQYFEINATPQAVNLFVATDGATQVVAYVYLQGELAPVGDPAPAEGNTFAADALTFDPVTVLDGVATELPESDIVLFTVSGGPAGAVQYGAVVQSDMGGTLDIVLGPDGTVESVVPS